jgi:excisionase family DNA binding protein
MTDEHAPYERDRLLSIAEASGRLGIGRPKMNELLLRGEVASCKIGARRQVSSTSLDAFIARAFARSDAERANA